MDDKINILLVDDQPAKLLTYEAVLGELGENIIKARSGMEALEQLLRNDIALVIMDVSMPGMDGFETAEMIHQHPRFQNTPIVFVSGICLTEMDRLKGYRHGAVDYVPIPVTAEVLRAKVRVFTELHRKTRQLELLNARMTILQEEERERIARELHDSVGQLLVAIKLNNTFIASECSHLKPEVATTITENDQMVEQLSKEIRTISYLLHPQLLEEAGLASALQCYLEGFSQRSGIRTILDVSPDFGRLPAEVELSIFRMVQECLTNVHRHSGSPTAETRLTRNRTYVEVEVEDAGKGIPKSAPTQSGVGLLGMRERLRQLGGTLRISANNPGTRITAVIPLPIHDSPEQERLAQQSSSESSVG